MPYLRFGSGEPLVLIHGLGEIKEGWNKQFELADQYDLIIPDLRGHGENSNLDGISISNFAKDILSLLDELSIKSAHICGFSLGGAVAQEIYKQAPEKCHSLLLINTFHYSPKYLSEIVFEYSSFQSLFLSPQSQKSLAAKRCLYSWSNRNIEDFSKCYQPNRIGYTEAIKACLSVDNRLLLPTIKVPTLVIGSQYDTILPVNIQIHMHKQIPNSNLVIFRDAGHLAKLEARKAFNQTLRDFLSDHQIMNKAG